MSVVCKLFTFQSSPLKLLGLLEPNFSGMMFLRSCINILCSFWKKENKTKKQKQKKKHPKNNNGKGCSYSYWPLYNNNMFLWNYSANWNQTLHEYCWEILCICTIFILRQIRQQEINYWIHFQSSKNNTTKLRTKSE